MILRHPVTITCSNPTYAIKASQFGIRQIGIFSTKGQSSTTPDTIEGSFF